MKLTEIKGPLMSFYNRQIFLKKKTQGPKLSKNYHEKVKALHAKRFLTLKTRLISQ